MPFLVNECEVIMKIDSGADVNVIAREDWLRVSAEKTNSLDETLNHKLLDYNGNEIETLDKFTANIRCPKSTDSHVADFSVNSRRPQPVLSFSTSHALGILLLHNSVHQITQHADRCFPCMPIAPVMLRINSKVIPKSHVYNNIPASLEKFFERSLG